MGDEEKGWWNSPRKGEDWWKQFLPRPFMVVCILWVGGGVYAAKEFEGWDFLTALYVITQIVTTIGYGDITVSSPQAKIFCAFYVAGTLVIIGTAMTDIAESMLTKNTEYLRSKIRAIEAKMHPGVPTAEDAKAKFGKVNQAIASGVLFALFVAFGTVFYALYEPCSCSYGHTAIAGCVDGGTDVRVSLSWDEAKALETKCYETGGVVLTWVDAFYMSVITLTTVGFGDHSPKTQVGRAVGIGWMVLGVVTCGAFVSTFGALILERKKENKRLGRISGDLFKRIDTDGNGELSRVEFRTYALLKFGIMTADELAQIDNMFDTIDEDKSGALTYREIERHCDGQ